MDCFSKQKRSDVMRCIRSKDTGPEMLVRRGLHKRGYRYRLHRKDLPGSPDLVLPAYKTVIFVHGCFWHMHNCQYFKMPKTREKYWVEKLTNNAKRDKQHIKDLTSMGWKVIIIWECITKRKAPNQLSAVLDLCEKAIKSSDKSITEIPSNE